MNKFEYPKDARFIANIVAFMNVGDVIGINDRVYTMETVDFPGEDRNYYLSAYMKPHEGDVNGYRYIHCRVKGGRKAVFGAPASIASAINRQDVEFS